jgi:hypothetical protein
MKLGGAEADRALDHFEATLGAPIREGGESALGTFEHFYLTALERGNEESRMKFVARFLPMLPSQKQLRVRLRFGIDERGNLDQQYRVLQRELAAGGAQDTHSKSYSTSSSTFLLRGKIPAPHIPDSLIGDVAPVVF